MARKRKSDITQVYNPKTKRYVARGESGQFIDVNDEPNEKFKGVDEE